MNLAVNGRDAMPLGGPLVIETANVSQVGEHEGDWVRLSVRDRGTGMSPDVQAHLFEPFFTTKPQGKGTGLGLATVFGIVTQIGGFLKVASTLGGGSTFEAYFPRLTQVENRPQPATLATMSGGREWVLLVEDDSEVREISLRTLRNAGYQVLVAAHAEAAFQVPLEQLRQVSVLVTDVVMPGLDGKALADELTSRHPALKVLFVSGYTHDAISKRGVIDSGIKFLAKPYTGAALLTRVREVLEAA